MKRLVIIPLLLITACTAGCGDTINLDSADTEDASSAMTPAEAVDEIAAITPDLLYDACDAIDSALDSGADARDVAEVVAEALEDTLDGYTGAQVGQAVIAWCTDHGYS